MLRKMLYGKNVWFNFLNSRLFVKLMKYNFRVFKLICRFVKQFFRNLIQLFRNRKVEDSMASSSKNHVDGKFSTTTKNYVNNICHIFYLTIVFFFRIC